MRFKAVFVCDDDDGDDDDGDDDDDDDDDDDGDDDDDDDSDDEDDADDDSDDDKIMTSISTERLFIRSELSLSSKFSMLSPIFDIFFKNESIFVAK